MSERVLLTGVSGFLGGHIALGLLAAGYTVRGSVRKLDRADKVRQTLANAAPRPPASLGAGSHLIMPPLPRRQIFAHISAVGMGL